MKPGETVSQTVLPQAFKDAFFRMTQTLHAEINSFSDIRKDGWKTKADRVFLRSCEEATVQAREKKISFGYAVGLLVDAIFAHMASTRRVKVNDLRPLRKGPADYKIDIASASRLRVSDARLYRAVNSFLDQERRAWAIHCPNVSTLVERDLSTLRRGFISEMYEDGYVMYDGVEGDKRIKITQALVDNYYSPLELRGDETPLVGDFSQIFRKG